MTRSFRAKIGCPRCGYLHTVETPTERWIRGHPSLDSRSGIVRFDLDILIHRYLFGIPDKKGRRDIQCLMFVEVKTFGANLGPAQADTLSLFAQVLRNGRDNVHRKKRGRHAAGHVPPTVAWSSLTDREVQLRLYGGHLLELSGDSPDTSEKIWWDRREITAADLIRLLRFDLNPNDPTREIDWRRRWCDFQTVPGDLFADLEGNP